MSDTDKKTIEKIIKDCIEEIADFTGASIEAGEACEFVGSNAVFDSLGLIHFVNLLERKINSEFSTQISLVQEMDFSDQSGAFRNLQALAQRIELLVGESTD